jgi:Flp pilus assembly protein TadD
VFTNENYEKVKERMNSKIYLMNPEEDPEYWNKMAYSLTAEGKLDKAKYYYEKALDVDPDNKCALNNLANIFLEQGKKEDALKYLKYVVTLYPDSVEPIINLGVYYQENGDLDKARDYYNKAKICIRTMRHCGIIVDEYIIWKTTSRKQFQIISNH